MSITWAFHSPFNCTTIESDLRVNKVNVGMVIFTLNFYYPSYPPPFVPHLHDHSFATRVTSSGRENKQTQEHMDADVAEVLAASDRYHIISPQCSVLARPAVSGLLTEFVMERST